MITLDEVIERIVTQIIAERSGRERLTLKQWTQWLEALLKDHVPDPNSKLDALDKAVDQLKHQIESLRKEFQDVAIADCDDEYINEDE